MQYESMGDEQKTTPLWRFVSPSDFDRARDSINNIIREKYPGWDWLNIALWRKLGLGGDGVARFLNNYMLMARTARTSPTDANLAIWKGNYLAKYPGSIGEDVEDFFDALMSARKAGMVADTIFLPWTYEPETPLEELAKTVAPVVAAGFNKLLVAGAVVAIAYLSFKTYISSGPRALSRGRAV
jgi:hypothetical protein